MKRKLLGLGVFLLAVCPLVADTKPAEAPAKPVTVPFEVLPTGHMAVQVKINGKGPYRLLFDTGAPTTLFNNRIANDSGLLKDKKGGGFALFGNQGEVKVDKLEVGDVAVEGMKAVVMDHP